MQRGLEKFLKDFKSVPVTARFIAPPVSAPDVPSSAGEDGKEPRRKKRKQQHLTLEQMERAAATSAVDSDSEKWANEKTWAPRSKLP